tara:strand:+ start:2497 stop:4803 length:2307 start_codon:yes stop_codon:yes gene_type:complete
MRAVVRLISVLVLVGAVLASAWLGAFEPPDQELQGQRFAGTSRAPSGDMVFVEIDATSLQAVGVWPWPRTVHAALLDRLIELGALEVVFDIDFSAASTPQADGAFEAALTRAGGYAYLAAFQQIGTKGEIVLSRPLPRFEAQAPAVLVNVDGDGTALLESVPSAIQSIPALAYALVPQAGPAAPSITIDYGIDLSAVPSVSAISVLEGTVDPAILRDKQVVIGASAIELRDFFRVPRFGVLSGAVVQIAATETLKADRALSDLGFVPAALAGLLITALVMLMRKRFTVPQRALVFLIASLGLELAAWQALSQAAIVIDTMVFHAMVSGTLAICFLDERARRWRQSRRQQAQLAYLARHDEPSGALSRHAMLEALAATPDDGLNRTLIAARLLRLDALNASLGNEVYDMVAHEVTARLHELTDTLPARLDSDIFAFSVRHGRFGGTMIPSIAMVTSVLEAPYEIAGHTIMLETVFGSANQADADGEELLQQAEIALAVAQTAQARLMRYEPEHGQKIRDRRLLDLALRQALKRDEFYLLYQPQIDLKSGEMVGLEALLRWRHPELGIVSPADFIPLAEETGLIVQIGEWILHEACRQVAQWRWQGRISINVSAVQFQQGNLVAAVHNALVASGLPPHRLDIEITESMNIASDPANLEILHQLSDMGVRIAMDDFGTGYSSLSYLHSLPIHKIKIDQSFVRNLPNAQSEVIIETTIIMAQRLGKTVIAEGVETKQQRDYLASVGCDVGQGYLFGRPSFAIELALDQTSAA